MARKSEQFRNVNRETLASPYSLREQINLHAWSNTKNRNHSLFYTRLCFIVYFLESILLGELIFFYVSLQAVVKRLRDI